MNLSSLIYAAAVDTALLTEAALSAVSMAAHTDIGFGAAAAINIPMKA